MGGGGGGSEGCVNWVMMPSFSVLAPALNTFHTKCFCLVAVFSTCLALAQPICPVFSLYRGLFFFFSPLDVCVVLYCSPDWGGGLLFCLH